MWQRVRRLVYIDLQLSAAQVVLTAFACLGAALAGQQAIDQRKNLLAGGFALGVAAVAFAWLVRHTTIRAQADGSEVRQAPSPSFSVVATALCLALLGCVDFGGNRFRPAGMVLWAGGLAFCMLYLWLVSSGESRLQQVRTWLRSPSLHIPAHWLVLTGIVLIGAWFRLRLLHEIPADLGPDLIYNYFDAWGILNGKNLVFFPESHGREGLFFYCIALCARLVGLSQYTLHLTSALVGLASIVAMYWLGEEAFGRQVGLLAALLLAVNRWHITLSRAGYRVIWMPLFTMLVLYALMRALRKRQLIDFAWAGVVLGLGIYTYKSSPFVFVAAAAGLALYLAARGWPWFRPLLPGLVLMAAMALVIMAPTALYALENPRSYFERELVVRRLQGEQQESNPGLPAYYWRNALAFNYVGDSTSRWNVPGARHMGLVSGALMLLGLAHVLLRWRDGHNGLIVAAWFVLILPGAMGMLPRDLPNSLRLSGTMAPAVLLAALPLPLVSERLRKAHGTNASLGPRASETENAPRHGWTLSLDVRSATRHLVWSWQPARTKVWPCLLAVAAALLVALEAREANRFYFHDFVWTAPDVHNYSNSREIAREIEHYGDLQSVFVKTWPYWFDGTSVRVTLGMKNHSWDPYVDVLAEDLPPLSTLQGPAMFIVNPEDQAALDTLRVAFSRGVAVPRYYPNGDVSFYCFYAEH